MNSNLTRRGTWLFAATVTTLGVGVVASDIVVVWLACCLVLGLALAYGIALTSALVLDRRFVTATIRETSTPAGHGGYVVGDEIELDLVVDNHSALPIFGLRAEPYGPEQLDFTGQLAFRSLDSDTRAVRDIEVTASRSGRWMLHGFDVTVTDPFGILQVSDYLPCNFAFEFYPSVGRLDRYRDRRHLERRPTERDGRRQRAAVSSGTVLRELREYEPGDPLRHVAWKATARNRKLISRDFEDEVSTGTTIVVDISGSMRGGEWQGQKLEHAIELTAGMADELISQRNRVGLVTFDEKVYGYVSPGSSQSQYRRILHHLLGLNSIVDPDLTELDDRELRELLVDYLLVQERLDFRKGGDDQINDELLDRWIESRLAEERRLYHSPVLKEGLVDTDPSPIREFVQLRGLPVPYRVESRLGPKGRGMAEALERTVHEASGRQEIIVVSDLCGISNFDVLDRGLALANKEGHQVRFVVPFTPSYYTAEQSGQSEKRDILMELFTASEREERMRGVEFLERRGIRVEFVGDDREPMPTAEEESAA